MISRKTVGRSPRGCPTLTMKDACGSGLLAHESLQMEAGHRQNCVDGKLHPSSLIPPSTVDRTRPGSGSNEDR